MKKPELLMPAGSYEKLKDAILFGADAVYFGAKKFSARAGAENMGSGQMRDSIDFCHKHKKKAYIAINTLIKDSELKEAIELARSAYELGIDAAIVQDLGLAAALKKYLPGLRLHASTQLNCNNVQGAKLLRDLGFKRIVLARELSLKQVSEIIRGVPEVEIEVFVHGALCFSYSGQCLFSSFAFNKSGNRGRCLQPCRMKYKKDGKQSYYFSMKDQMTAERIGEIISAGAVGLKVEGRLKSADYVRSVARLYRTVIDSHLKGSEQASKEEVLAAKTSFLREHDGSYLFGGGQTAESPAHKGVKAAEVIDVTRDLLKIRLFDDIKVGSSLAEIKGDRPKQYIVRRITIGKKDIKMAFSGQVVVVKLSATPKPGQVLYHIQSEELKRPKDEKYPYTMHVYAKVGQKLKADISVAKKQATVEVDYVPEESKKFITREKELRTRIGADDDFFSEKGFSCELFKNPFIPATVAKELGNKALEKMREIVFERRKTEVDLSDLFENGGICLKQKKVAIVSEGQKVTGYDLVVVSYEDHRNVKRVAKGAETVKSPHIQNSNEVELFAKASVGKTVVCSELGALFMCIAEKKKFWAGPQLNCYNSLSTKVMLDLGAEYVMPSVECSLSELKQNRYPQKLIPMIYFSPKIMVSAAKTDFSNGEHKISDKKGFEYRVVVKEGLLSVYNPHFVDLREQAEKFCFGGTCEDLRFEPRGVKSKGHFMRPLE